MRRIENNIYTDLKTAAEKSSHADEKLQDFPHSRTVRTIFQDLTKGQ